MNLYFKVLEKVNFVHLQVQPMISSDTQGRLSQIQSPDKVLYCQSSLVRKLTTNKESRQELIQLIAGHDQILLPFFSDGQPPLLVTLTPAEWRADLF